MDCQLGLYLFVHGFQITSFSEVAMVRDKEQELYDIHTHGININKRDVYLHSHYISDESETEPGVEYRQAITFIKNLHFLDNENSNPILVHLHSIGGCWDNGMAIFNAVEFAKSPITMLAYAQASSMSGIIFQSPLRRVMMPDCHFLMHHGYVPASADHPFALKNKADQQIKASNRMLQIFAKRANVGKYFKSKKSTTIDTIYDFFDQKLKEEVDWLLSSEEAVYYGLADGVLGTKGFESIDCIRKEKLNGKQKLRPESEKQMG